MGITRGKQPLGIEIGKVHKIMDATALVFRDATSSLDDLIARVQENPIHLTLADVTIEEPGHPIEGENWRPQLAPYKPWVHDAALDETEELDGTVQLDRSREQWENAALEMGIQLDAYAKLWGIEGSNLAMNLRKVTREKHDYRAFLRKFARMGEQIRVNDDEFDYVFYTYGLELYGNLPLVEPVEFAEEKRIRDFVIAIDTSASTKDGLVRKFIERTYSILADETSFFSHMNVLIVQCDAAITDVARITCLSDLEDYLENPTIKGLGGTDFRPVFTYVDEALATGALNDLGGLIYFTDGQGTYPTRRPAYETAFVFLDSDDAAASAPVPPWAMKVILDETFVLEEEPL